MRVALTVVVALGAILLFLLASASANTALFAQNYPWLLAINGIAAAALLVLVALQLRRLRRDFRQSVPSRKRSAHHSQRFPLRSCSPNSFGLPPVSLTLPPACESTKPAM